MYTIESLFTVDKAKVLAAAKNAKRATLNKRGNLFKKEMKRVLPSLVGWLFGRKPSIKYTVVSGRAFDGWRICGWGTLETAEELIDACSVAAEEKVYLSTADAAFVNRWQHGT